MIRDTFETNPGLCELFKRKILDRARFAGLSEGLIDFGTHIDMKGTYEDNLRIFYREYPQLSQNSDYLRIKSIRALSGAALEQAWRSYERNNGDEIVEPTRGPTEQPLTAGAIVPELVITYTIGSESVTGRKEGLEEPEPISMKPTLPTAEANLAPSGYREIVESILDHVTAVAGEKVTKTILFQTGQEIGRTAFDCSRSQILFNDLGEALDRVLSVRGWGRVLDLSKTEHGRNVTYACAIKGYPICPTCDIMSGIVSGWLESFAQKKTESIETDCVAPGFQPCVFRVTFRK
jgi:predicted hydrocarbon binding protein